MDFAVFARGIFEIPEPRELAQFATSFRGKEWIASSGEHFERSQQAHVIKARLS